jgi:hypothetical protein
MQPAEVAEAVMFIVTRPHNVTIRDLLILPQSVDLRLKSTDTAAEAIRVLAGPTGTNVCLRVPVLWRELRPFKGRPAGGHVRLIKEFALLRSSTS